MFQSILSNLAIILLGHLLMNTLMNNRKRLSENLIIILVILLFSGVIITMFYLPIIIDNYRFDLRLVPLIFLAVFRGWKVTIPVLVIVSSWRLLMGGEGAIPGVLFGLIIPTLFALPFYKANKFKNINLGKIMIITVCWFISDFPIIFILPNGIEVFERFFLIRYSSFIAVSFIYYVFILEAYKSEALKNKLEVLASHDSLTGLLNRKKFISLVEEKINNKNLNHSLAMLDIDHFKHLNDTHGHIAGDKVLMKISSIFKKYECPNFNVARYGGEEFIIYQSTVNTEQAINTLEEIQNEIRKTKFKIDDDTSLTVLVSIGFAKFEDDFELHDVIKLADMRLYLAKKNGRDQLVVSQTK